MRDAYKNLLSRLKGAKPSGNGQIALCPAHEDQRVSLSVNQSGDGTLLLKCFAGCTTEAVLKAIDMKLAELFPAKLLAPPSLNGKPKLSGQTFPTAKDAVANLERQHGKHSVTWTYHDAKSAPVGLVVRWEKPDGKDIRPVAKRGDGWRVGAMPAPRPLYRLPELAAARRVVVCEGEKAADAASSIGFAATTSAGGSQAAAKSDWRPLAGRDVWIFPDNDTPGK